MAQSAPRLLLAAFRPTETVAEHALAPTSREPFGLAVANVPLVATSPNYFESYDRCKTSSHHEILQVSVERQFLGNRIIPTSGPIAPRSAPDISQWREIGQAGKKCNATGVRLDVLSNFIAAYKSLRKSLAVRGQSLIKEYAAFMGTAIVGVASTYNPYRVGVELR